jgi:hypothetical protein
MKQDVKQLALLGIRLETHHVYYVGDYRYTELNHAIDAANRAKGMKHQDARSKITKA